MSMLTVNDPKTKFTDHLEELRKRLITSIIVVFIGAIGGFFFSDPVIQYLIAPIQSQVGQLYFFSPQAAFLIKIKVSILCGLIVTSPIIFFQIWLFISPGLFQKERRMLFPVIAASSLLFIIGSLFAYYLTLPLGLKFLLGFQSADLKPHISISEYISFASMIILSFGVAFNLPIFIVALTSMGLVQIASLGRYRKHAIVIIFILSAILSPPDMISQILLALPLIILYEASILAARLLKRK